jgi:cytochrome b561
LNLRGTATRYGPVAQTFHWLTVLLVLAAYLLSEGGPEARVYSIAAESTRRIHETLGILAFGVVLLRLLWRLVDPPPSSHVGATWRDWLAKLIHLALYALLVAIPVTAILGTWYEGHPLTLLVIDIAPAVGAAHDLGQLIIEAHTTLGNVILWIAGLHAAAAVLHHFYFRDAVLRSMLPGGR